MTVVPTMQAACKASPRHRPQSQSNRRQAWRYAAETAVLGVRGTEIHRTALGVSRMNPECGSPRPEPGHVRAQRLCHQTWSRAVLDGERPSFPEGRGLKREGQRSRGGAATGQRDTVLVLGPHGRSHSCVHHTVSLRATPGPTCPATTPRAPQNARCLLQMRRSSPPPVSAAWRGAATCLGMSPREHDLSDSALDVPCPSARGSFRGPCGQASCFPGVRGPRKSPGTPEMLFLEGHGRPLHHPSGNAGPAPRRWGPCVPRLCPVQVCSCRQCQRCLQNAQPRGYCQAPQPPPSPPGVSGLRAHPVHARHSLPADTPLWPGRVRPSPRHAVPLGPPQRLVSLEAGSILRVLGTTKHLWKAGSEDVQPM